MNYLKPGDPHSFDRISLQEKRDYMKDNYATCPKCLGHGAWNMSASANASKFHCTKCNGYGYVHRAHGACACEMEHLRNVGNCLNEYKCKKCGSVQTWDSGD